MKLIDSHAHLDLVADLPQALEQARQAGVTAIVAQGRDRRSGEHALKLASDYPGFIFPSLGLHPYRLASAGLVSRLEAELRFVEDNLHRAVALGEVGLDYKKELVRETGKELQHTVLERLLDIAGRYDKPVLVHSRYAWRDALNLVQRSGVQQAVFHWFTGPTSVLRSAVEAGYFLSATPACVYHQEHRRAVKETPLDRLLLETDSPVYYRGLDRAAGPADVAGVLGEVAAIKGLPPEQVAEATTANSAGLFKLKLSEGHWR